jgi:hypothetical protein
MSFNCWKQCGGNPGQPGIAGEYAKFDGTYERSRHQRDNAGYRGGGGRPR